MGRPRSARVEGKIVALTGILPPSSGHYRSATSACSPGRWGCGKRRRRRPYDARLGEGRAPPFSDDDAGW